MTALLALLLALSGPAFALDKTVDDVLFFTQSDTDRTLAHTVAGPLSAVVTGHVDGDTFAVRIVLPLRMTKAACAKLTSRELYPGLTVRADCRAEIATKIRLLDVDAPEIFHPQCDAELKKGQAAAVATALLVPLRSTVLLYEVRNDEYAGRSDARVVNMNRVDVGAEMLKRGLVIHYGGNKPWCTP